MANPSRAKGVRGESEVRRILTERDVSHVWYGWADQLMGHGGGCDIRAGLWVVEVKRTAKRRFLTAWMKQAEAAAARAPGRAMPVVVYRRDAKPGERVRDLWRARTKDVDKPLDAWIEQELQEGRLHRTHPNTPPKPENAQNARFEAN